MDQADCGWMSIGSEWTEQVADACNLALNERKWVREIMETGDERTKGVAIECKLAMNGLGIADGMTKGLWNDKMKTCKEWTEEFADERELVMNGLIGWVADGCKLEMNEPKSLLTGGKGHRTDHFLRVQTGNKWANTFVNRCKLTMNEPSGWGTNGKW